MPQQSSIPAKWLRLIREAEHAPQQRDGQGRAFRIPTGFGLFLHRLSGGALGAFAELPAFGGGKA